MAIITLTTDFGPSSPYVAIMKGVILSINPAARIVDITHAIAPQEVRQGALALAAASGWFPPGTIHVAVVDPGVGSTRKIIYARVGEQHYVLPDNGLLSGLARYQPLATIIHVSDPSHWLPRVSATFHGRDIMAPVAARLSLGLDASRLGPRLKTIERLAWPEVRIVPGKIVGAVESIDSFGNLITDITEEHLQQAPSGHQVRVVCDEHETHGIFRTYADQPPMTLLALVGSGGRLEISIVGDSAADMLGISVGTPVTVTW